MSPSPASTVAGKWLHIRRVPLATTVRIVSTPSMLIWICRETDSRFAMDWCSPSISTIARTRAIWSVITAKSVAKRCSISWHPMIDSSSSWGVSIKRREFSWFRYKIGYDATMRSFLPTFWKYVHVNDVLVLAVSGGVDSMVMLDLVMQAHPHENIVVAHFDHSLRWVDSDQDRDLVHAFAWQHHLDYEEEKKDIRTLAETEKKSIEAVARRERYAFLEKVKKKYTAKYILTAHHADDQIETVIMHLLKWGKFQWLSGIAQISGHIFRPLLKETKSDILYHAEACHISYREDASNSDLRYDRNKIRHQVVPVLRSLNPSLHTTIEHLVEYSQEVQSFLSDTASRWLDIQVQKYDQKMTFSAPDFALESIVLQREIIAELYRRSHRGSSQGLSNNLIKEIVRFITERSNSHGKKEIKDLSLERRGDRVNINKTSHN